MRTTGKSRFSAARDLPRVATAIVFSLIVDAAHASSLGLTDTVTYPGSVGPGVKVNFAGAQTTVSPTPTVSFGVNDSFNGSSLTDFPFRYAAK